MTASTDFKLSIYQQGLIEFMTNPDEKNAICNAVAGSGKSTTLFYVALTRSKEQLYFVGDASWLKAEGRE
jgi:superfamily I DNA/RNA helicase